MVEKARPSVSINNRRIGADFAPYIVAEMSGNHNGSLQRALETIDQAKAAGADSLKIQTYRADTITIDHDGPEFMVEGGLWDGQKLFDLYNEAHTPWEWHEAIFARGREIGLTIFSSPFDFSAVDLLEDLGAPAYKIASPELIDLPLIARAAATGKPLVLSTGMATLDEISDAVEMARSSGCSELIVLHCTSSYPSELADANLTTIGEISRRFDVVTGLSDHSLGTFLAPLAVAAGASVIEKHFTLDRADAGVDSAFSIEPQELAELVANAKMAHSSLGRVAFEPLASETSSYRNRRSLFVVQAVRKGDQFSDRNVRSIRPGNGIKPKHLFEVHGRRATRDIAYGEPLAWDMVSE